MHGRQLIIDSDARGDQGAPLWTARVWCVHRSTLRTRQKSRELATIEEFLIRSHQAIVLLLARPCWQLMLAAAPCLAAT